MQPKCPDSGAATMARSVVLLALLSSLVPRPADAQSFDLGLDLGPVKWLALVVAVVAVGLVVYHALGSTGKKRQKGSGAGNKREGTHAEFVQRAAGLGFRLGESRTLERIATRLAPKSPHNLLTTSTGLDYLMADLQKRVTRRRKEVDILERIHAKLRKLRQQDVHERGSIRVEADMPIWVMEKKDPSQAEPVLVEDEEEEETDFDNLESVAGRLLDISEGGAAIRVDLPAKSGDRLDFWSADSRIVLSTLTAGVVSVEKEEDKAPVLHLHFIDPDLRELRMAMADIKEHTGERSRA